MVLFMPQVGGKLSDRFGGGRVSLALLIGMILGGGFLVAVSTHDDLPRGPADPVTFLTMVGYIAGFIALFILSGAGKGSVYKLTPSVFEARSRELNVSDAERRHWARVRSATLIGFAGALGGVGINLALRQSYDSAGTETPAFWIFLVCYIGAAILARVRYARQPRTLAPTPLPLRPTAEVPVNT
jgi:MFS transporter, NNP family, nitrate/nitrite transporter